MGAAADGPGSRLTITVVGPRPRVHAAAGLGAWLARAAPARARGEVTVALVSDQHIRRLNASFRHVDAVTDVLSFPAFAEASARQAAVASRSVGATDEFLGDIAIAVGVARRQARAEGHALRTELRVLALHGLLHLLGYDHEADGGRMRRVEDRLRRQAGLPAGLTARAERGASGGLGGRQGGPLARRRGALKR